MKKAGLLLNRAFTGSIINRRLFGSFIEHMGRTVYSGIYEKDHRESDADGFRTDVIKAVKDMGVSIVRYPGGNFVSAYDWRNGRGLREQRPRQLELAWMSTETNEFGINEFMRWSEKAEVEPLLTVNLGTRGMEDAIEFLEYCNHPSGTAYSDLRISDGVEKPYAVKTWCLGNEMDGEWQIGHKTAQEYGRLAKETAKVMKLVDPRIELVSCGSSRFDMPGFPQWDAETLEHTYEYVDYLALHQYFGGQEKGTPAFLAQALDMDRYIETAAAVCDYVKVKKRSKKTMMLSIDEWGVWSPVMLREQKQPWQIAPSFSEQIYSLEDALLFGGMLLSMLRHCDRVKIACQSLLVNISAAIITEPGGSLWLQPIFYPFAHAAKYGKGRVLTPVVESPSYSYDTNQNAPVLDSLAVLGEEGLSLFLINRDCTEDLELTVSLQDFGSLSIREHLCMHHRDPGANNLKNHGNVVPVPGEDARIEEAALRCRLPPLSWNVLHLTSWSNY